MPRPIASILRFLATLGLAGLLEAAGAERPPPPPDAVPPPEDGRSVLLCVGCDDPFDTVTHKALLDNVLANPHARELRRALYVQDILHQFESRAHFDNCDFDSAVAYIASLMKEADGHVAEAGRAVVDGREAERDVALGRAFFALGQALHAVQDFYAHSNYVEMAAKDADRPTNLSLVRMWREEGRKRIAELHAQGLVSGYVFWGFPQRCPDGTPWHGDMAKDSPDTKRGEVLVPHLQNLSLYRLAVFLARESSLSFMEDAFRRWPLLREASGRHLVIDIMVDRRGLR